MSKQREKLSERLDELESLKEKQGRKIALLEDKVRRQSAMNEQQNAMITWGKKFQTLVNEYSEQQSKKGKEQVVGRFKVYAGERASQNQEEKNQKKSKYQKQKERKIKKLISTPAQVGDRVKLIGSRQPGEIVEIKKNQYLLSIGALSTWVTRDKFIPAESLHGDKGTIKGKARGGVQIVDTNNDPNENSTKTKSEEIAEKKKAKKSAKTVEKETKTGKKEPKQAKNKRKRKSVAKAITTKEKLKEASKGTPLKQAQPKKSTGKKKEELTPEQKAQIAEPVGKLNSPIAKATKEEPRKTTDADLEKLKAFFGKK